MIKEKFEIILSLTAGLVMTVACFFDGTELMVLALRVLITMIVFFFIGVIVKWFVIIPAFPDPVAEIEEPEDIEEISGEAEIAEPIEDAENQS